MAFRRTWPLACVVFLRALCPCNQLLVPGTSKQARTLRTGRFEQIPGRTRTIQEQALAEELRRRARTLRDEASFAEAALAASRATRAQQESACEQLIVPVGHHEEDHSVACTRESTKPRNLYPPCSEATAVPMITRIAACMVVASFWVFIVVMLSPFA
jgi:hypothetical protein